LPDHLADARVRDPGDVEADTYPFDNVSYGRA